MGKSVLAKEGCSLYSTPLACNTAKEGAMRFDENIRNILILKLKYPPASLIKLERNSHLVQKVLEAIDTLKQKHRNKEAKQYALAQLHHIKKLVAAPTADFAGSMRQERKAYYSFSKG
ncbi:MAG: hypothetical protein QNL04_11620 [SAR324 cluster bacterium]|nr:hypothetical protein [SAR324 cluster bacterium]